MKHRNAGITLLEMLVAVAIFGVVGGGLRVRIVSGLSLNAEAAIWNGFLLRGGVAYRF